MHASVIGLFVVGAVFINNLPAGSAIQCYVCNSGDLYEKGQCVDIKSQSRDMREKFTVNCSAEAKRDGKYEYVMCRTLVQDVEGEERIVRSCGTRPDIHSKTNRCIDRTGTAKIKLRYCECDTDLCNSASVIGWSSLLASTVLMLSIGLLSTDSVF